MSTYEAWRATYQDAEAAAKAAFEQAQVLAKMVDGLQATLGAQVRFAVEEFEKDGMRLVNAGELQMVVDALRRLHAENQELKEQMAAIGAGGVEPLRKRAEVAPQAVQAAVPLPLLVRDIARDLGITVPQACIALKPLGNYSTNSAVTAEMARMLRDHFPAPAHPAEGVPAQTTRDAVIQHLTNAGVLEHDGCGIFIASGDASELIDACMALSTHAHHEKGAAAQAVALLATGGQAQADAQDTNRWMEMGKAIERACADLPEETEIIVSLEKDAGTVTLIDRDGNEHENFSCDHGFAGVLNEAIDAAIAAQAKKGGEVNV